MRGLKAVSVRSFQLSMVPSDQWLKRKHMPDCLNTRVDIPSFDCDCQTVDSGSGYLGYITLNNFGYSDQKIEIDGSTRVLSVEKAEPLAAGKSERWRVAANDEVIFIDKRAADQWNLLDLLQRQGCTPFFICLETRVKLVYVAPEKSLLAPSCRLSRGPKPLRDRISGLTYSEAVRLSRNADFGPFDYEECVSLAKEMGFPKPDADQAVLVENGTSFPEQAVLYYVRRAFPDHSVLSRDRQLGPEIDVHIPDLQMGVEYNGARWHKDREKDLEKKSYLARHGVRLLEICEADTFSLEGDTIRYRYDNGNYAELDDAIRAVLSLLAPSRLVDVDVARDQAGIYEQFKSSYVEDSLAAWHPEVLAWWSPRNFPLSPFGYKRNSQYAALWECPLCGFEWRSSLESITSRIENQSLLDAWGEWGSMDCPHCKKRFRFDDSDGSAKPIRLLPIWVVLPRSKADSYMPVEHYGDDSGVLLNGPYPGFFLPGDSEKLVQIPTSMIGELNEHPGAAFFGLLDMVRRSGTMRWWHCEACGENYLIKDFDYLSSETCERCGARKDCADDIAALHRWKKAQRDEEIDARSSYLLDAYARFRPTVQDIFNTNGFWEFVMSERPDLANCGMFSYYLRQSEDLVSMIQADIHECEQRYLMEAYDECLKNGEVEKRSGNPLVRDIRNRMPEQLKSGVSRMIKESGCLISGRHGVSRVEP